MPVDPEAQIRRAAIDLIEAMCDCQSFEVEYGAAGEGPLIGLIKALGIPQPPALKAFLEDGEAFDAG